jgi:hypothetical protein
LLAKNGQRINSISLKEVEIEPEYKFLFGHRFNLFKRIYLLKFPVTEFNFKIENQIDSFFKLIISSTDKDVDVLFAKDKIAKEKEDLAPVKKSFKKGSKLKKKVKPEKVVKDDDYYWI